MAGDEYRETVNVEYLGEQFAVPIRPLTETELTDVQRQMKISLKMFKSLRNKIQAGEELTDEEKNDAALKAFMEESDMDVGDLSYLNFITDRFYCQKGIADDGLKGMVLKFRWGLTDQLAKRIKTISEVPPEAIANFFGPTKAIKSS